MARAYTRHDWTKLDPLINKLVGEEGYTLEKALQDLGVKESTYRMHRRTQEPETPEAHPSTPAQQGKLEGYEEVMEDVQASVPEMRELMPEEEHPSTPEHTTELSVRHSQMEHSGVPSRIAEVGVPMGHRGTRMAEDWELWEVMKTRWGEVEKLLAEQRARQALVSTPSGTPRHTIKKTYVVDTRHVQAIDAYARAHGMEIKDVVYLALEQFFGAGEDRVDAF